LKFILLKKDEIPAGVTVSRDTFVVPFWGAANLHNRALYFAEYKKGSDKKPLARIEVDARVSYKNGAREFKYSNPQTVGVGDLLTLQDAKDDRKIYSHRVVNIVPSHEENKVIGWVELASKQLPRPSN
jgi:hypothetical protein